MSLEWVPDLLNQARQAYCLVGALDSMQSHAGVVVKRTSSPGQPWRRSTKDETADAQGPVVGLLVVLCFVEDGKENAKFTMLALVHAMSGRIKKEGLFCSLVR